MSVPGCAGECGRCHADGHCGDGTPWVAQGGHTTSSLPHWSLSVCLAILNHKAISQMSVLNNIMKSDIDNEMNDCLPCVL